MDKPAFLAGRRPHREYGAATPVDHGIADAQGVQDFSSPIHSIPFPNGAQVQLQTGGTKTDSVRRSQFDLFVADAVSNLLFLRPRRCAFTTQRSLPQIHERRHGDIEFSIGQS